MLFYFNFLLTPLSFGLVDVDSKINVKHPSRYSRYSLFTLLIFAWKMFDIKQSSCTGCVSMAATDPNRWTYRSTVPSSLGGQARPRRDIWVHFSFQNDEHLSAAPTGSTPLERWCWAMKPRSHSKFQLILKHWAEHSSTHLFWPWELPDLTSLSITMDA